MSLILGILDSGGAAASTSSYESIATVNSTGSSATLTFSAIPSGYASLQIRGLYSGDGGFLMKINGSSSAIYAYHLLKGDGSSASASGLGYGSGYFNFTQTPTGSTTTLHACIIDIHDYASTTKNKTLRMFDGYDENGDGDVTLYSGLFGSTNAITSITLDSNGNWLNNTQFALYGIKG
jgi:hypothetical protein